MKPCPENNTFVSSNWYDMIPCQIFSKNNWVCSFSLLPLTMIYFSFLAIEELFKISMWVLFFNIVCCFILNFLYLHSSDNNIYSNVTHLLGSFQGSEVLLAMDVADSTTRGKGRNLWPILQGNVTTPNLENQQQLEIAIMEKARWVFLYKLFPSHG